MAKELSRRYDPRSKSVVVIFEDVEGERSTRHIPLKVGVNVAQVIADQLAEMDADSEARVSILQAAGLTADAQKIQTAIDAAKEPKP